MNVTIDQVVLEMGAPRDLVVLHRAAHQPHVLEIVLARLADVLMNDVHHVPEIVHHVPEM
jgi:hypothetical protein